MRANRCTSVRRGVPIQLNAYLSGRNAAVAKKYRHVPRARRLLAINLRPRAATLLLPAIRAMTMHHVRRVRLEFRNPSNGSANSLARIARYSCFAFDTRAFLDPNDRSCSMDFKDTDNSNPKSAIRT